jgi:NTE family protein
MRKPFFTFLILLLSTCAYAQPYKYLVLEGGGIRGIAYAGAMNSLEQHHILESIERVTGTSVGSIVAGLIAVGYSADEMRFILYNLKLQQFNDGKGFFIGGFHRMKNNYGWYRGNAIEKWVSQLIASKTGNGNLTFEELHALTVNNRKYKDLYVAITNLSKQQQEIYSYETHPTMPIQTAIRASLSIPLYFGAVFIDSSGKTHKKQNKEGSFDVLIDGGVIANYPICIFDTGKANPYTLGLKLERPEQLEQYDYSGKIAPYTIKNLPTYISAFYNLVLEQLNKNNSFEDEKKRTVYISTGNVQPKIKRIPKEQKDLLYNNGFTAVEKFLANQ